MRKRFEVTRERRAKLDTHLCRAVLSVRTYCFDCLPGIGLNRDTEELRGDVRWGLQELQKCLRRKMVCARLASALSVQGYVATMSTCTTSMIYILQGLEWSEP